MKVKTYADLMSLKERGLERLYPDKPKIMVGMATCGIAAGAKGVFRKIADEIKSRHLDVIIRENGCLGCCHKEPLVDVVEPGSPRIFYGNVTESKVSDLLNSFAQGKVLKELVLGKMVEEENIIENRRRSYLGNGQIDDLPNIPAYEELPFFRKQKKIVLRNCGFIDPDSIEDYIARGGYLALWKVLKEMTPQDVIGEIIESGLRGRGGAGFPTGLKWKITRQSEAEPKYIICNADEGDPGAYMDRSVLECDPHSVLEGMIIGAYAIGASQGYMYVRAEYPLAVKKLIRAISLAEEYGFLGENIFDSGFSFRIFINKGAGAFVCGEETALLASIEGKAGEPRSRPPFPAQSGLWGKPTTINNVETWANIPFIIARGSAEFARIGTQRSKGTKVFSLVGDVKHTGLVEVPMGITLREIIEEIGGGTSDESEFKAVQTGGPSGGCIPKDLIDLPVDYESLTQAGSIMGSGGMVVMGSEVCMVDVAKYFLTFVADESCGKCTPCRLGTQVMKNILANISRGVGSESDIEMLEELGAQVKAMSLCGLGQTAPNPVLTTIRYFRKEYEKHIFERKCPAHVCRALLRYSIIAEKCTGCTYCLRVCPTNAINGGKKVIHTLDREKCNSCGACYDVCKFDAVMVE